VGAKNALMMSVGVDFFRQCRDCSTDREGWPSAGCC
jgi:hypothetical protein